LWQRKEAAGDDKGARKDQQKLWEPHRDEGAAGADVDSPEEQSRSLSPPPTDSLEILGTKSHRSPKRQIWSEGRGHAHDPLRDHLYLDVGPHPSEDNSPDQQTVSESPGAVDFDVFSKAYQEEVGHIREVQGEAVAIFSTRRMDKSGPKKKLAGLLGRAVEKTQDE